MYYNLLTLVHGHVDSGSYAADVDTNAHGEDIVSYLCFLCI